MPTPTPTPKGPEQAVPPRTPLATAPPVTWTPPAGNPSASFAPVGTLHLPKRGETFKPADPAPASLPVQQPVGFAPAASSSPFPAASNR